MGVIKIHPKYSLQDMELNTYPLAVRLSDMLLTACGSDGVASSLLLLGSLALGEANHHRVVRTLKHPMEMS